MNDLKDIREMRVFDYLEGNLSSEETIAFDNEILYDSYLKDELISWKKTYLIEEDFNTSILEAKILDRVPRSYNILWYLNILLVLCITFISGHQIHNEKGAFATPATSLTIQSSILHHSPQKQVTEATITKEIINNSVALHLPAPKQVEYNETILAVVSTDDFSLIIESMNGKTFDLLNKDRVVLYLLKTRPYKVAREKYIMSRADIRKRARQSSRYKRKELERRQALEFQKGNTPYVVPIDMKRF